MGGNPELTGFESYGDMVLVSREQNEDLNQLILAETRRIMLEQAMETLRPFGAILEFKFFDSKSDVLCEMPYRDDVTGEFWPAHSEFPHFHVGWKARARK